MRLAITVWVIGVSPARLLWKMPARQKRSARVQRRQRAGAASAFVVAE